MCRKLILSRVINWGACKYAMLWGDLGVMTTRNKIFKNLNLESLFKFTQRVQPPRGPFYLSFVL